MKQNRSHAILISLVILGAGAALAFARSQVEANVKVVGIGLAELILALFMATAIPVADQWDRAVILRLDRFRSLKGPGLFLIIPVLDAITDWIDTCVITTGFKTEKTLTKDTVPVDVDVLLFWKVGAQSWQRAEQYCVRDPGVGRTTEQAMRERMERLR